MPLVAPRSARYTNPEHVIPANENDGVCREPDDVEEHPRAAWTSGMTKFTEPGEQHRVGFDRSPVCIERMCGRCGPVGRDDEPCPCIFDLWFCVMKDGRVGVFEGVNTDHPLAACTSTEAANAAVRLLCV